MTSQLQHSIDVEYMLQGGLCDLTEPVGGNALGLIQALTCSRRSHSNRREVIHVEVIAVPSGGKNCDDELTDRVGGPGGRLLIVVNQADE